MQGDVGRIETRLGRRRCVEGFALDRRAPLVDGLTPARMDEERGRHRQHAQRHADPQPAQAVPLPVAGILQRGGCCRHLLASLRQGCFGLCHARQFAFRGRPPGAPDIDIGLAQCVTRQGVADARLVGGGVQPERSAGIGVIQPGDQVQQHRCAHVGRQAPDARQRRGGGNRGRLAQRRRRQQQAPVLARPFGDRPLPGLAREDPCHDRQGIRCGTRISSLDTGKQPGATIQSAQERSDRRGRRGIWQDGGHGRGIGTAHLSFATSPAPPQTTLDTARGRGSASNGAGCRQTSCAQPPKIGFAGQFHASHTIMTVVFHGQAIDFIDAAWAGCFFASCWTTLM